MKLHNSDELNTSYLSIITYQNYIAEVTFDDEDNIFCGNVIGINDVLSFEGDSLEEAINEFYCVINGYIKWCNEYGKEPEIPFRQN